MKKMGMIGVFVGAMVGGCFGVVVTCLAVAAKRADEQDGIYEPEISGRGILPCRKQTAGRSVLPIRRAFYCLPFPMGTA